MQSHGHKELDDLPRARSCEPEWKKGAIFLFSLLLWLESLWPKSKQHSQKSRYLILGDWHWSPWVLLPDIGKEGWRQLYLSQMSQKAPAEKPSSALGSLRACPSCVWLAFSAISLGGSQRQGSSLHCPSLWISKLEIPQQRFKAMWMAEVCVPCTKH